MLRIEYFELHKDYSRNALLEFLGSKQSQSGILWGPLQSGCVILTSGGRHSKRAGYHDVLNLDGMWTYFGQGEKGDQDPTSFANNLLIQQQRTILLFTAREPKAMEIRASGNYSKKYRFEGYYRVAEWDWFIPNEGSRKGSRLLKFKLVPINLYSINTIEPLKNDSMSMQKLRKIIRNIGGPTKKYITETEYRERSKEIRNYARMRADGVCEYCIQKAPFITPDGQPFLEVHHILRLADDGPDLPENVAALCPNCHRDVHYGIDALSIREKLIVSMELPLIYRTRL